MSYYLIVVIMSKYPETVKRQSKYLNYLYTSHLQADLNPTNFVLMFITLESLV